MREILFRAKGDTKYNEGGWIEGYLIKDIDGDYQIFFNGCCRRTVIPETIGQYTGLTDKNGTTIFEGDIIFWEKVREYGQILYDEDDAMFYIEFDGWIDNFGNISKKTCEVVGNIHDNPESLEGKK